ncbi:MAG TPA: hypothetical protein VJ225_05785 [Nitrososphaeraceae archaeon]|nr:hypothetical protein [Nitrososphaeraceae archaeon]
MHIDCSFCALAQDAPISEESMANEGKNTEMWQQFTNGKRS